MDTCRLSHHKAERGCHKCVVSPCNPFKMAGILETCSSVEVHSVIWFLHDKDVRVVEIFCKLMEACGSHVLLDTCGYESAPSIIAGQMLATSSDSDAQTCLLQRTVCGLQMSSSEMTDVLRWINITSLWDILLGNMQVTAHVQLEFHESVCTLDA